MWQYVCVGVCVSVCICVCVWCVCVCEGHTIGDTVLTSRM